MGFILALGTFFILPNNDDFYCLLAPHKYEDINVFLPNGAFWRPLDALWGIMMGKCVGAFPYLNHLLVLLLYTFCIYGLTKILDDCNVDGFAKKISIALFIIRKTKCFRIWERNAIISKTKRNFSRLYPTPQNFKKIDRLRRNEIHLKAVRTPS